jgi:hypothetical protein
MTVFERFSYEEYLARALSDKPAPYEAKHRSSRDSDPFYNRWCGSESFDEARTLALEGWPEGRELVGHILSDVETQMDVETQQIGWDVTGDFVDVGAYVTGQPENMMRFEPVPERARVARLLMNMSVSSGVTPETIRWRGATLLALIDKLEASGVRVELDMAYCCTRGSQHQGTWLVNLKRAEEPVHLDLMAFHLTHPSSFRRIFFSFVEQCSKEVVNTFGFTSNGSYGTPASINALVPSDQYDLIVPHMHLHSVKEAIAQIEAMFSTLCSVKEVTYAE